MNCRGSGYTFGMETISLQQKKTRRAYILSIAAALAIGALGSILTRKGMEAFTNVNQPKLSPPMWLFPVVWTILYILMGISAAMIYETRSEDRREALLIYGLQLFMNFAWTVLFFGFGWYLAAFIWIVVLEAVIVITIATFAEIRPKACYLLVPYALWVAFAAYLNLGVYLLN